MQTCSGRNKDGTACPCCHFKACIHQKEDEPDLCHNCQHFDTCHPDNEARSSQPTSSTQQTNIAKTVSRFTHLLKASEDVARKETNDGFRKKSSTIEQRIELQRPSGSKETESDFGMVGVGSVVIITVGL
ncbi:hypothetical protein PAXRUDRAFT_29336, partial [Paxillus rubicundulus Ve08.2h10]